MLGQRMHASELHHWANTSSTGPAAILCNTSIFFKRKRNVDTIPHAFASIMIIFAAILALTFPRDRHHSMITCVVFADR
jgi:hypothetical protein